MTRTAAPGSGVVRDCQCTTVKHEHGTRQAYRVDMCRCDRCRAARASDKRAATRRTAYGRAQTRVPAAPVRKHLLTLCGYGIGGEKVAALSGINAGTIYAIRNKRRRYVMSATADALLAIQPTLDVAHPLANVDSTGTARRIQALATLGYTQRDLAAATGISRGTIIRALAGPLVNADTARRISGAYDRLWNTTPPADTQAQRQAAAYARNRAARDRWAPPLAWDDDTIDNTKAKPGMFLPQHDHGAKRRDQRRRRNARNAHLERTAA